LRAGFENSTS